MPESADTPLPDDAAPPTNLGGVDAGELLARGMHTVKMSSAGAHGWEPPALAEVAALFPTYEILSMLGRGGMGAVYKARQIALDRFVAIKLLPLEISVDQAFVDRFRREARAMAKLNHPHIISVFDFGQTAEGHLFFVMEFVEGANLAEIIHQVGLAPDQTLALAAQVCTALAYAHGKGVVHRDIKPANVMVDAESQVKVADFGLALLIAPTAESNRITATGIVMGTPGYMAPEQAAGGPVDGRADIYSLGVLLYAMLCGEPSRGAFVLPAAPIGGDPRIDVIVRKAMQQNPGDRYQDATEMQDALDRAKKNKRTLLGIATITIIAIIFVFAAVTGACAYYLLTSDARETAPRDLLPDKQVHINHLADLGLKWDHNQHMAEVEDNARSRMDSETIEQAAPSLRTLGCKSLYIYDCPNLQNVDGFKRMTTLTDIAVAHCPHLQNVDGFRDMTTLAIIRLGSCENLENIDGINGLTSLRRIILIACPSLQNVDGLKGLTSLKAITLTQCRNLQNVDGLKGLTSLKTITLTHCRNLQNIDGLTGLTGLTILALDSANSLQNVDGLKGLAALTTLDLFGCVKLQNVDGLKGLTQLRQLDLRRCPKLPENAVQELRAALPQANIESDY